MQPGAVFFFHLFNGKNFSTQGRKLGKLLLNCFQPFMPLAVSDLGLSYVRVVKPVLFVQLFYLRDFFPKTPNFFSKNLKMIHTSRIAHLRTESADRRQELTTSNEIAAVNQA